MCIRPQRARLDLVAHFSNHEIAFPVSKRTEIRCEYARVLGEVNRRLDVYPGEIQRHDGKIMPGSICQEWVPVLYEKQTRPNE